MKFLLVATMLMTPRPNAPLPGVTVRLSTGQTAITDANGEYAFDVPDCWTGTVAPSLEGYSFTPQVRSTTCLQQDATADFEAVPVKGKGKK